MNYAFRLTNIWQRTSIFITAVSVINPRFFRFVVSNLCYVFFILIWHEDSSIHKYSLIKAKLQLQNNDPNIQTKNKNDLKYFLYYNYNFF